MPLRLCTAAEMKFYFSGFFGNSSYLKLKPNNNCNLTSWVRGCEPGWACRAVSGSDVDMKNSAEIPARTLECQPCCEGFFCPRGLTCMIPCPLGSHCPTAMLDRASGLCQPYTYQLPPADPNHTCGGANIWADVKTSRELFCSPGSYCPSSTEQIPCSRGHYCPTGSTYGKRCFKLTSCDSSAASQNIHAYGIMLIAAITTILLIIYNCSDQILTTRERRNAKSREAAARQARLKTKAHERWKTAKAAAKKWAKEVRAQVSPTFSRTLSHKSQDEELMVLSKSRSEMNDDISPHPISSGTSQPSSSVLKGEMVEPSGKKKSMDVIEEDLYSHEGISLEIEEKNNKSKMPKEKPIHTRSQIFNYAYAQIEREKALQQQNQNLTLSGVVSMALTNEIRKRPVIEIAFRDLTLTLKGEGKHLLKNVTGKIMPGHITAVMGPSGAGKTTFLSALAGKAVGCKITGSILVNGKPESIHSYKKITGFVPQDDVVHGNLTVEENLWFSAKCRLPASMMKPDKFLIVERVIESLGLQAVRNSVVGTVERRGISGGQRKRVNVGLEMVMEPSLLILDEPTSGLDSSSSQLLLRALRRETLGRGKCLHGRPPTKMFDDLVLLAKGGLTVYHGSARKVEEYFATLGIIVPERVTPPDYFIDVLEGIVKPSTSLLVNYEELPVRWMLHKGYPVPPDMQKNSVGLNMLPEGHVLGNGEVTNEEQSFAGEVWQDVRSNVEMRRDILLHNFLRANDLSCRKTPGVFRQYRYFLGRIGKQRLREAKIQAVDYLTLLLAGACLGSITKSRDETFGAAGYTYTIIAVSLLCQIAALRSFSLDKLQYLRERGSGISSLAHFLAKDTIDHFNTVIKPAVYLSMFYSFSTPRSSFTENYIVLLCLVYCVTGIAYLLAIFLEPGPSQLFSVLLPVVLTLVSTQTANSKFLKDLSKLCYPKWALEAFVISNAERYYGVWMITRCGALRSFGYRVDNWGLCIFILILYGVVSRVVAFFGMLMFHKK